MKKTVFLIFFLYAFTTPGQSPYKLKPAIDFPVTVALMPLNLAGLRALRDKPHLDSAEVAGLRPEDVNKFDRGATHNFSHSRYSKFSDAALFISLGAPFLMAINKNVRKDALKIGFLYIETMALMGNAYVWGVSAFHRKRPYVYNPDIPLREKLGRGTTNSFFAGHPAAAACAAFFAAKVFNDCNPDSKLRKVFWGAAVIPPAIVGYLRYKDGQHFPTDILTGIPIGAAIGILVPHLHKVSRKSETTDFFPYPGGLGMIHRF